MKDSELIKIRKTYEDLIKKRDRLKSINDRMKELEQMPEIQEYMKLYKEYDFSTRNALYSDFDGKTNEELACCAVSMNSITPTNNIYFYVATGIMYNGEIEYIDKISEEAIEFVFANIEEFKKYKKVKPDELQKFLENNIVIYPTQKTDCHFCYQIAHNDFLAKSVIKGQEKAVEEYKEYAKTGYPWKAY